MSHELQPASAAEIPVPLTRFVGREREITEIEQLVGSNRLLTLTGAGGSGKTRLALAVTERVAHEFSSVTWVDLAPLTDPLLLVQHVATALHVPERSGTSPLAMLSSTIGSARALLVLDNCERLVDSCADISESLLRTCPRLVILTTSREALGVTSELAWLVPPLDSDEATRLFTERAQANLPSFALTATNEEVVRTICRRLDGIPLAIELASARIRVLSPEQIAQRLDDAFRLLTAGSRTALPRHRTLRATMEWSFALLATREQVLLRRLAVFAGSFTLDAAEAVCTGEPLETEDILDGVTALVDKSLVAMEPDDNEARYRLLETVRQYANERLSEAGEVHAVTLRHVHYFVELAEKIAPDLVGGSNAPGRLDTLCVEYDNLRAATTWSVADPSRAELGLRLTGALYWFWYAMGQFREARQFVDRALALDPTGDSLHRGRALVSSALTALAQGDYALSRRHFTEAIPLLRAHDDQAGVGSALAKLGAAELLAGELPSAVQTLEQALDFTRDWPRHEIAVIFARFWRSWAAYAQNDLVLARELMTASVDVGREYDLPTTRAHATVTLARIELARGVVDRACELVLEGLELEVAINDAWGIGLALDVVTLVAEKRGRASVATRLMAAVEAHRERVSAALPGPMPAEREQLMARLRSQLGDTFETTFLNGAALSTTAAVSLALSEAARHTTEHRIVDVADSRAKSASERPRLRVQALGPLQVSVGDRQVESSEWGSARARELLIYLLMHPGGRTKEQTGLAFWPDASTSQLRNSFHVTLHRLRKALGPGEWVTRASDRYGIDQEAIEEFDVLEFERALAEARDALKRHADGATARLEQALSSFRGDFLDGEPAGDWHLEHRDRLQRQYVSALMQLGERHGAEERHGKAADAYRRVLARDELHERAVFALMRAHVAVGERSQALRAYRRYAEKLQLELEAEPGREVARFFEELQGGVGV